MKIINAFFLSFTFKWQILFPNRKIWILITKKTKDDIKIEIIIHITWTLLFRKSKKRLNSVIVVIWGTSLTQRSIFEIFIKFKCLQQARMMLRIVQAWYSIILAHSFKLMHVLIDCICEHHLYHQAHQACTILNIILAVLTLVQLSYDLYSYCENCVIILLDTHIIIIHFIAKS